MIAIGTAGWSIPRDFKNLFSENGSHLERYARVLSAVEINSSFYQEHKPETYVKWAAATPADFKFSLKLLKYFTHEMRLGDASSKLKDVIDGSRGLGEKWGVLLVQLPPSLAFDAQIADQFIAALRKQFSGTIAWEPRHISWASDRALDTLAEYKIAKVLADPEKCWIERARRSRVQSTIYLRLHGRPIIYRSDYSSAFLVRLQKRIAESERLGKSVWCMFDNTTFGFATKNAIDLKNAIQVSRPI